MKKLAVFVPLLLLCAFPTFAQHNLEITLKHNSEKEIQKQKQLERLLNQYNLSKWIFTTKVLIDEGTQVPHSHPVLTLNTRQLDDDLMTLSTFVHEQIHWHEEAKAKQRDKAIEELKTLYPGAPAGPPEGARDQYSTYLHLLVCHLEYEAMKELVGAEKAKGVIEALSRRYYKWVYRTVLDDGPKIAAVLAKHNLKI